MVGEPCKLVFQNPFSQGKHKEVDGIKFAFKTEIVTGPQTIVIEADQVIVNEEIDDDFFN